MQYWLTQLYTERGDYARAEKRLLETLSADPSVASWYMLGKIYVSQGKIEDAERAFREAMKFDRSEPSGLGGLLQLYRATDQTERLAALVESIPDNPEYFDEVGGAFPLRAVQCKVYRAKESFDGQALVP